MKCLLYIALVVFFISCSSRDTPVDKNNLLGDDYRLFQDTPVWTLAKAVQDEDTVKIKNTVHQEKIDIDYQEPIFGETLLILTVRNQHYNSCKVLLELGANPNKHDNYNGVSAMIEAANIENHKNYQDDNTRFLRLLLRYGGNPNDEETGERQEGNTTRRTPLLAACKDVNEFVSPIEKVKLLVEAGANVNCKDEFNGFPIKMALMLEHYDVVLYLLQKGADYNKMLFDRSDFSKGGKKIYMSDLLREHLQPLESEKYKQKMLVVDFLKQKGIDYRKIPIPDFVVKETKEMYPDSWKEYLEKY